MEPGAWRGRAKRVTDPLDDKVKARLRGDDHYLAGSVSSSGSEHEGNELSSFVDGFFFCDNEEDSPLGEGNDAVSAGSDGEGDRSMPPAPVLAMVRDLLKPSAGVDRFRRDLAADVMAAVQRHAGLRPNRPAFRREVMSSLRESGYNSGICKARWESRGGVTAGSYEYIDVVTPATQPSQQQLRYVVDVEFAGEFEIARPTTEYARVAAELPRVYVGKPEELRRLLRLLADAVKRSLRAREMHVPPWRKGRYMQAKWLGPYRRTLNAIPSGSSPTPATTPPPLSFAVDRNVKCRCVGFDAAAPRAIAPAARTR